MPCFSATRVINLHIKSVGWRRCIKSIIASYLRSINR